MSKENIINCTVWHYSLVNLKGVLKPSLELVLIDPESSIIFSFVYLGGKVCFRSTKNSSLDTLYLLGEILYLCFWSFLERFCKYNLFPKKYNGTPFEFPSVHIRIISYNHFPRFNGIGVNATKVNAKQDTKLLKLSYEELIVTTVKITAVWAKRLKWIWTVIWKEGSSSCFSPPLAPPSHDGIALWRQYWRFFSFSFSICEIELANSFSLQCPKNRFNGWNLWREGFTLCERVSPV